MSNTTNSTGQMLTGRQNVQRSATTTEYEHTARVRHIIERIVWVIGFILLFTVAYLTHMHKGPWPGEVEVSRAVQAIHYWPWLLSGIMFFSSFNDVPPSIIEMIVVVLFMLAMRWFKQVIFFALTVGFGNGMNILIGDYVGRPRPSANLIHVDTPLLFNSFPSGHTEHDVVFYGTLFYLTLTRPVREWRYRRVLLPFQIFAVVAIFCIGYSRIQEGEHWVTDVLGGYLSGLLWLSLGIFIYHWVNQSREKKRAREQVA